MNEIKFLDYAAKVYYEGRPVITDQEFDDLAEQHNYVTVGYDQVDVRDTVAHPFQMFSLQKIYEGESTPPITGDLIESTKLDGAAVDLVYLNGFLRLIITRGDGIRGQDVSHLIPAFPVEKSISIEGIVQITGEVVAPKDIPNSRNYASGALQLHDIEEFKTRDLVFVAYGIAPTHCATFSEDMECLDDHGFNTVLYSVLDKYPNDGKVFRINNNAKYEACGYTSKHPKGAYALKTRKAGITTTLLDVVWQVGKSGAVSPVAILKPVVIGEANVSRATLHNMKYINELGLEIGCEVEVIRSGEIIPRVVRRV
jgi:DNA ligase (NAD+)